MSAQLIDGKAIAEELKQAIRTAVDTKIAQGHLRPGLAVVLVGADPASQVYVKHKKRGCEQCGFASFAHELDASASEAELLALVEKLNADDQVHGILVQLPLPKHMNADKVIEAIAPHKDVDGFHPYNVGRLATNTTILAPCTPHGVMTLLRRTGQPVRGQNAVVVGASNIVGVPMMLELLNERATVTICHSATQDLQAKVSQADLLVVGVGKPNFIAGDWIKPGAVVIDVGINRLPTGELCGDVDFASAKERAAYITPVPGGVGPMTIATLLQNTYQACYGETVG